MTCCFLTASHRALVLPVFIVCCWTMTSQCFFLFCFLTSGCFAAIASAQVERDPKGTGSFCGSVLNIDLLLWDVQRRSLSRPLLDRLMLLPSHTIDTSPNILDAHRSTQLTGWLMVLLHHYSIHSGCVSAMVSVRAPQGFYFLHTVSHWTHHPAPHC